MLAASENQNANGMPRVLVAGCGDVGQRVARRMHALGSRVHGLRRSARPLPEGVIALRANLSDPASLLMLPPGIDQLVYLPTPDTRTPEAYRRVFLDGLRNLLAVLDTSRLQRIVFVSSSAVYGDHAGNWVDEDTPPMPMGFNGSLLLEAEQWLASSGLPATVLRLAGLYGPGRESLYARIRDGRARAPLRPTFWANRIHAEDAAAAIVHLLGLPDPAPLYLGVDNTPLPLAELYDFLAACLGAPAVPEGDAPHGIGNKRLSNARLRDSGFAPLWPDARDGYAALLARRQG
jgi:nucleoside-diphosphate-sugar epimerase